MGISKVVIAIIIFNIVTSIISRRAKKKQMEAAKAAGGVGKPAQAQQRNAPGQRSAQDGGRNPQRLGDRSSATRDDAGMDADRFEGAHPNKWRQDGYASGSR